MITSEKWREIFNSIKENFLGEVTYEWFEIDDDTLDDLEGNISALRLRNLMALLERKISRGHLENNLRILNYSPEEVRIIMEYSHKLEGRFPQLLGKCQNKKIIITPAKTEVSFYTLVESDFEIALTIEGKFSSFKKRFDGYQDISIDDKEFDDRFIIKGNPEDRVIEFLSHSQIRDLIRSFEPVKSLTVDRTSLHIIRNIKRSDVFSEEDIFSFISRLGLLANAVENPGAIEHHRGIIPEYKKKIEVVKNDLTVTDRLDKLERRFDSLEKKVESILFKLGR